MNILIIGGAGFSPSANSVCVRNMIHELIAREHKVWVLAAGDECVNKAGILDGAELWQIPDNFFIKLWRLTTQKSSILLNIFFQIVRIFRYLILIPFYPQTSLIRSVKVTKKTFSLVRENKIDLAICIFNSYDNINAGINLKKKLGDKIKVVSYHLDLRTASINSSSIVRHYIYKHALASLIEENRIVDKMLIPYSGQKDMESLSGVNLGKVHFVGFPVYISESRCNNDTCELPFSKDCVNISYIGSLSSENRNPDHILYLLGQVTKNTGRKIKVHFWGDVGDTKNLILSSPIASYHGKIDNKFVYHILNHSDFLLNIGNAIAYTMLPSKVFGMFATGKPIINIITHPQDATIPFFDRYNHSINIREFEHSEEDITLLTEGLNSLLGKPVKKADELFEDFKPTTICDIILS